MPRTALNPQLIPSNGTGLTPVYTAAEALGHICPVGTILHVKNGGGSSINVTIQTGGTLEGRTLADDVIAVPNAQERMIHLASRKVLARQASPDLGSVYVDFSAVTTVTVALLKPS